MTLIIFVSTMNSFFTQVVSIIKKVSADGTAIKPAKMYTLRRSVQSTRMSVKMYTLRRFKQSTRMSDKMYTLRRFVQSTRAGSPMHTMRASTSNNDDYF